jgi:hypothetical protein
MQTRTAANKRDAPQATDGHDLKCPYFLCKQTITALRFKTKMQVPKKIKQFLKDKN